MAIVALAVGLLFGCNALTFMFRGFQEYIVTLDPGVDAVSVVVEFVGPGITDELVFLRSTGGGEFEEVHRGPDSYLYDENLTPETEYTYRVTGTFKDNESEPAEATTTTLQGNAGNLTVNVSYPGAPDGTTASIVTTGLGSVAYLSQFGGETVLFGGTAAFDVDEISLETIGQLPPGFFLVTVALDLPETPAATVEVYLNGETTVTVSDADFVAGVTETLTVSGSSVSDGGTLIGIWKATGSPATVNPTQGYYYLLSGVGRPVPGMMGISSTLFSTFSGGSVATEFESILPPGTYDLTVAVDDPGTGVYVFEVPGVTVDGSGTDLSADLQAAALRTVDSRWFVSGTDSIIFSIDDGESFTVLPFESGIVTVVSLSNVRATGAGNGRYIIAGRDPSGYAAFGLSTDATIWSLATVPASTNPALGIANDSGNNWVAVGSDILYSGDNGDNWADSTYTFSTAGTLVAVATDGGGNWLAVGTNGLTASSTDNGANFAEVPDVIAPADAGFTDIGTDGAGRWVAAAGDDGIYVSDNLGLSWSRSTFFSGDRLATDGAGNWIAVDHGNDVIEFSLNNGDDWFAAQSIPENAYYLYDVATDGDGLWMAYGRVSQQYEGDGGVIISTDNGLNWQIGSAASSPYEGSDQGSDAELVFGSN